MRSDTRTRDQLVNVCGFPPLHIDRIADGKGKIMDVQLEPFTELRDRILGGKTSILQGVRGTGKTHLACGIAWSWTRWGKPTSVKGKALYWTMPAFLSEQASWYTSRDGDSPMTRATGCGLLVIDEAAVTSTSHSQDTVRELVDARYRNKRATVLITNLTQEGLLEALDDPTLDRCLEGNNGIVEIDGGSLRGAIS